jgi:hypothetical protein
MWSSTKQLMKNMHGHAARTLFYIDGNTTGNIRSHIHFGTESKSLGGFARCCTSCNPWVNHKADKYTATKILVLTRLARWIDACILLFRSNQIAGFVFRDVYWWVSVSTSRQQMSAYTSSSAKKWSCFQWYSLHVSSLNLLVKQMGLLD